MRFLLDSVLTCRPVHFKAHFRIRAIGDCYLLEPIQPPSRFKAEVLAPCNGDQEPGSEQRRLLNPAFILTSKRFRKNLVAIEHFIKKIFYLFI